MNRAALAGGLIGASYLLGSIAGYIVGKQVERDAFARLHTTHEREFLSVQGHQVEVSAN